MASAVNRDPFSRRSATAVVAWDRRLRVMADGLRVTVANTAVADGRLNDRTSALMLQKSLDAKLARIHADPHGCKDFILADAKDADMALAIGAPGRSPEAHSGELRFRSLAEYRDLIEQVVAQGLVDIMLMSASTSEVLTIHKRLFDTTPVTPAARANDTTDVHIFRGGRHPTQPSLPFRTATLDHMQCGHVDCGPEERRLGVDLGLYSITFNNDTLLDRAA